MVVHNERRYEKREQKDNHKSHNPFIDLPFNGAILGLEFHSLTALLSCVSTAQPASRTVPPILYGGQYRSTDLPIIFLAGRGPLSKHNS